MKNILLKCLLVAAGGFILMTFPCCRQSEEIYFARVENGRFVTGKNDPYCFIGTNLWYGPILASQGPGGDRGRLHRELDRLQELGVDNLRVLVGAEGPYGKPHKIEPVLQPSPGEYDDDLLDGLDYFMAEIGRRNMYAVLYLTNTWEWSGGYGQYLEWSGHGTYPVPGLDGWNTFVDYAARFHASPPEDSCKQLLARHIGYIVSRTNRYTGKPYSQDPAIFSWQICNEPRPFGRENKENFDAWIVETARLIKSIDPNHMVSTGSEGEVGCERDIALWESIHAHPEIDYANIHAWPYNWRWVTAEDMDEKLPAAQQMLREYIELHTSRMEKYGKPVVLEEFGFPRDRMAFGPGSPAALRNSFYGHVFALQTESIEAGGLFSGSNFWGWGGEGRPAPGRDTWQPGDDFTVDPAHEAPGLYSVFAEDDTCEIIRNANGRIKTLR